jgi:hypothetical protein
MNRAGVLKPASHVGGILTHLGPRSYRDRMEK